MMERIIGAYNDITMLKVACKEDDSSWTWRKWYEGRTGKLYLMRSRTVPSAFHICFTLRHKRWLTTGRGTYEIRGLNLVFTTKNSVYTFEISNEAYREELSVILARI